MLGQLSGIAGFKKNDLGSVAAHLEATLNALDF